MTTTAPADTRPTDAQSAQPPAPTPTPPEKPKRWFVYDPKSGIQVFDDPKRVEFLSKQLNMDVSKFRAVTFLNNEVKVITPKGEILTESASALNLDGKSLRYMAGMTQTAPTEEPAQPAAGDSPQPPDSSATPPASSQPPSPPSTQPPASSPQPSAPPPSAPVADTANQVALLQQRIQHMEQMQQQNHQQQMLLLQQQHAHPQQPVVVNLQGAQQGAIAPGALGAPLPAGQNLPNVQRNLTLYLNQQLPTLRKIHSQMDAGADRDQLNHYITCIQTQNGQLQARNALTYSQQQLQDFQIHLQRIVYTHLRTEFARLAPLLHLNHELTNQLRPQLTPTRQALLDHLLTHPAPAPLADTPELALMLALEERATAHLNGYLRQEILLITPILTQIEEPLPQAIADYNTELNQQPLPLLKRLITIDDGITTSLRTVVTNKVTVLQNGTQKLLNLAPFQFNPANGPLAGQSRAQLLLEPAQIRTQYDTYIRARHAQLMQAVRDKVDLPAAVPAGISDLEDLPQEMLDAFNEHIDEELKPLPQQVKDAVQNMPITNIQQCQAKYDAMIAALNQHLHALVTAENRPGVDLAKIGAMLASIGAPPAVAGLPARPVHPNLAELLNELIPPGAPAPAYPAPSLARLNTIRVELETLIRNRRNRSWCNVAMTVTAVAIAALLIRKFTRIIPV